MAYTSPAELLRETRLRHGLDQRTLARRAGTTQAQISRIERGEISPTTGTLTRLLAAMGGQLELDPVAGPRGNQPTRRLRKAFEQTRPEQRFAEAVELSETLSAIADAPMGPAR